MDSARWRGIAFLPGRLVPSFFLSGLAKPGFLFFSEEDYAFYPQGSLFCLGHWSDGRHRPLHATDESDQWASPPAGGSFSRGWTKNSMPCVSFFLRC